VIAVAIEHRPDGRNRDLGREGNRPGGGGRRDGAVVDDSLRGGAARAVAEKIAGASVERA
jgi:hypothetical protein